MRTYSLMFVVDPRVADDEVVTMTADYRHMMRAGGARSPKKRMGRASSPIPSTRVNEGKYVPLLHPEPGRAKASLPEVEHRMRQNEKILRFLTVRTDLDLKRAGSRVSVVEPPAPRQRVLRPAPPTATPRGKGGLDQCRPKKVFYRRRKVCKFCADKTDYVDFKDVKPPVQQFIPERSKILPRRIRAPVPATKPPPADGDQAARATWRSSRSTTT